MAITKPPVITGAYCSQGTPTVDYIIPPQSGSSTVQSQAYGWTSVFEQELPPAGSGSAVTRKQFNGVHNLYSSHNFWLQAGGTYVYEQTISATYGGYPAGQILWNPVTSSFTKSLVNSNTANYIITPSLANDGVNWQQITAVNQYERLVDVSGTTYNVKLTDTLKRFICLSASPAVVNFNAFSVNFPIGFTSYVGGTGADKITINATNTSNVAKTIIIPAGFYVATITWDGINWYINNVQDTQWSTYNFQNGTQAYATPGSYTFVVPALVSKIYIAATGGGGGGGGNLRSTIATSSGGAGGGSGSGVIRSAYSVTPGQSISITVGSGGSGGISGASSGGAGGNGTATIIGSPVNLTLSGGFGGAGANNFNVSGGAGGGVSSSYGGGGVSQVIFGGAGAGSALFPPNFAPQTVALATNDNAGTGGAGGTSIGTTAINGQPGGNGIVLIEW